MSVTKITPVALFLSAIIVAGPAFADLKTGLRAYQKRDYAKAMKEFKASGDKVSCYNIGLMYFKGEGVAKNPATAIPWFRKSAEKGFAPAQLILGALYDKGEHLPQDRNEAVKWYRKAGEQGNVVAQYNLGIMYTNGDGIEKDRDEALIWLKKAAAQGHQNARKLLKVMGEELPPETKAKTKKDSGAI